MFNKLGWMEWAAIASILALTAFVMYWRVQNGDPQAVRFYCDVLGWCAK